LNRAKSVAVSAHIATEHGRYLSKSANKQARTLELEFTLAPRVGTDRNKRQGASRVERNDEEGAVGYDTEPGGPGGGPKQIHTLTPQDFPALGNSTVTVQSRPTTTVNFTSKVNPFSGDDFPSLGRVQVFKFYSNYMYFFNRWFANTCCDDNDGFFEFAEKGFRCDHNSDFAGPLRSKFDEKCGEFPLFGSTVKWDKHRTSESEVGIL
jgi:hypothetical protein